jgi:hypothetical protein
MNFTRTPNKILDKIPGMKKNELKLTMLLVRLTFGYMENGRHREEIRLTFRDMMNELDVAKGTVNSAVQDVEKRGFFRRGRRSTWYLNPIFSLNTVQKLDQNGSEIEPNWGNGTDETVQKLDQNGSEIEPKKLDKSSIIEPFQLYKEKKGGEEKEETNPFPFQPPPKVDLPEHKSPADQRVEAILEICGLNASIPAHINQAGNATVQLRDYSAGQIRARYGPDPLADGSWHWYTDDWRGQRGDMPTPAQVVETIAKRKTAVKRTSTDNGRQGNSASARLRAQIDAMENTDNG